MNAVVTLMLLFAMYPYSPLGQLQEIDRQKCELEGMQLLAELHEPDAPRQFELTQLSWSPDGSQIAVGSRSQDQERILIWNTVDRTLVTELTPDAIFFVLAGARLTSLTWSPDGIKLAAAYYESTNQDSLSIWDALNNWEATVFLLEEGISGGLVWSPDSSTLAVVNGHVELWNVASGERSDVVQRPLAGNNPDVFQLGNRWYFVSQVEDTVTISDLTSGQTIAQIAEVVFIADMAQIGEKLYVAAISVTEDGSTRGVRLFELPTAREVLMIESEPFQSNYLRTVLSELGDRLAVPFNGKTEIRDIISGELLFALDDSVTFFSIAWSPTQPCLAALFGDTWTEIRILDDTTGEALYSFETSPVRNLAWSPDGTMLASTSEDGTVRIWGVATESQQQNSNG